MRARVLAAAAVLALTAACSGSSGDAPEVDSATPLSPATTEVVPDPSDPVPCLAPLDTN